MTIYEPEPFERRGKFSALVNRLRGLRWPEPSAEARRRCWEAVSRELHGSSPDDEPGSPAAPDEKSERRLRRHEFAAPACDGEYSGALGNRVAVARRASQTRELVQR